MFSSSSSWCRISFSPPNGKDGFENKYQNKLVETLEQIGRFTCFGTMIINIPHTIFGSGGIRKMNEQKFSGKGGVDAKDRRDYLGGV